MNDRVGGTWKRKRGIARQPFAQSCQSMSFRSIASIPRRMRQRRSRRFISSISTLRSALIAGPANLFVPFEAIFENDAVPEKWKALRPD